jgi:hypothetical protein
MTPVATAVAAPSWTDRIPAPLKIALSSPRHTLNAFLAVLLGIVALALILKIFVRVHIQHLSLITNGLAVTALIIGVYAVNVVVAEHSVPRVTGSDVAIDTR